MSFCLARLKRKLRRGDALTLENRRARVVVDRTTGWLSEFTDKSLDRDWVDDGSRGSFGHYVYDVYSCDDILRYRRKYNRGDSQWSIDDFGKTGYPASQGRETFVPRVDSVEVERGEVRATAVCRGSNDPDSVGRYGNAAGIEWRYTLYDDEPYVDVEYELLGKPETPLAESGHVVFPLRANDPRFRINKMGSVIDPREDIARSANTLLHCCENWVDVCDDRSGLAMIPLDSPLFSIGRNAMWDFEPEYRPSGPTLFFNLYNNWWGTNFPQWVSGDLRFRFRLLPHAGDWREGEVWRTATETMNPPLCFDGRSSEREEGASLIVGDLDGMSVTAFKPAEDGDGFVLRVRDLLGVARVVPIFLSEVVAGVDLVNLIEYGGGKLEWANRDRRKIHLETRPFEAHTLKLYTG